MLRSSIITLFLFSSTALDDSLMSDIWSFLSMQEFSPSTSVTRCLLFFALWNTRRQIEKILTGHKTSIESYELKRPVCVKTKNVLNYSHQAGVNEMASDVYANRFLWVQFDGINFFFFAAFL